MYEKSEIPRRWTSGKPWPPYQKTSKNTFRIFNKTPFKVQSTILNERKKNVSLNGPPWPSVQINPWRFQSSTTQKETQPLWTGWLLMNSMSLSAKRWANKTLLLSKICKTYVFRMMQKILSQINEELVAFRREKKLGNFNVATKIRKFTCGLCYKESCFNYNITARSQTTLFPGSPRTWQPDQKVLL